jgi:hypothetical protein
MKHLKGLFPNTNVEVFKGLNHGQLLIDYPEEVAKKLYTIRKHSYYTLVAMPVFRAFYHFYLRPSQNIGTG